MTRRSSRRPGRALAAALLSAAAALGADLAEEQQQFADGLYARGLHDLAIREYMALLRAHPDYARLDQVLYRLAESYRETGNPAAADLFYRRVIQEFPASPFRRRAELRRAELFLAANQAADAIGLLNALLAAPPPPEIAAGARYFLGVAVAMTGGTAHAEAILREVVGLSITSPYPALAAMELAALRRKAGAPAAELYELYRTAASRVTTTTLSAEAWLRMGDLAYSLSDHATAAEAYGRLLREHPTDPRAAEARLQAAWSLYQVGRAAEASKIAEAAVREKGDSDEWLYLLANCRRKLLDAEGAVETYDTLVRRFPSSRLAAAAAFEAAAVLHRQRKHEEAIRRLTARNWEGPLQLEADWVLAESYAQSGATNFAVQHYRRIVDAQPPAARAPDAMFRLGAILAARGARAEAAELLRSVADRHPAHPAAPAALLEAGLAHAADQRWEEAVADWARVERDHAASSAAEEALFQKGLAEVRLQRTAAAMESFQALLRRFPSTSHAAEARFWLGSLALEVGEAAAAEEEFRRALALDPPPELRRRIRFQMAGALRKLGRAAEAADLVQDLLATPSRADMSAGLLEWLARLRLKERAWDKAAAAAEALAGAAPDEGWKQIAAHLLGLARLGLGDRAGAIAAFETAADGKVVTRARLESLLELGRLHLEDRALEAAEGHLRRAAELASADELAEQRACALFELARVAAARDDADSAARYFLSVAVLYDHPELSPEALFRAAELLERAGQREEAGRLRGELRSRYPTSDWARRP